MSGKRANGEGSLCRRADGRWQCTIMIGLQADGKRKYKSFYGKTQAEAKKKKNTYQREKEDGFAVDENYSFNEWADIWFENHKDNISIKTQECYICALRIIKDYFADYKLKDVKPYDVEQFLKRMQRDGRSDSYLAKFRAIMYQILNKAEANDLVKKNAVRYADKMKKNGTKTKKKDAFTFDEVKRLMDRLPEDKIGWGIRLMLGTGMRTQELLALEPRHISEDGSSITIDQAVVLVRGTVTIGPPKSDDSYRTVPVPKNIRYCARLLRDTDKKFIWEVGKPNFPCNPSYFRKQFKLELEQVGEVRLLSPHCCRHTYVSQMQALGVDLATIQSIVGHADMDMTLHYLHVQDPVRQAAIAKFEEAFTDPNRKNTCEILDFPKSVSF